MEPALEVFEEAGTVHAGLFTLAHSPMHVSLYQKFGFWPRFLTLTMAKSVTASASRNGWEAYSTLPAVQQRACLGHCHQLTNSIYAGLDVSIEIVAAHEHRFGETILLMDGATLNGFAVCHYGPQTEGDTGTCYVKFGAVRSGPNAATAFTPLLFTCESLAAQRGMTQLLAGVNTARREAYRQMLAAGFRTEVQGLGMDRPDEPAYNRPGVYVIDDWR